MVFERVVMFIMSELPCLYHFDVRCSLIVDLAIHISPLCAKRGHVHTVNLKKRLKQAFRRQVLSGFQLVSRFAFIRTVPRTDSAQQSRLFAFFSWQVQKSLLGESVSAS